MNNETVIDRLRTLIQSTKGRMFSATFIKRTDGTTREMNARIDVKKHLNPDAKPRSKSQAQIDRENTQVTVFDLQKKGYRVISLEQLRSITVDGQTFEVPT